MPGPPKPLALIVSPHLDDGAFSAGATMAALKRSGWRVALATVFTASVPEPKGFALACQLDKGLGPEVDYLALRRAEDAAAARILGVDILEWVGLPEAPHRGYDSAPALFAGVRPGDGVAEAVARAMDDLVARLGPALILGPQGVGNHVDHLQVIRALAGRPTFAGRLGWYRDLPYAAKFFEARPSSELPGGLEEWSAPLDLADLGAKLDACAAYASQVGFQFGGEGPMRQLLADFAEGEGARLGLGGPAEAILVRPALASKMGRVGSP